MANTFGGFVHTSPLSSLPHDPHLTLASNCVRDCFGPAVQTVFDALQKRGGSATLAQLVKDVRFQCRRVWNEERERLVLHGKYKLQRARGPSSSGYIVEAAPIRAGLLVLLQHDIVSTTATSNSGGKSSLHVYTVHPRRARIIIRYPRFVEYVKKAVDEIAAALIETLVVHGKTGTVDAVLKTVNKLQDAPKSDKYTQRQAVVEAFRRLVEGGFVTQVDPISQQDDKDDDKDGKQVTLEDPAVVSLLNNAPYKTVLPRSGVWRINVSMFHQSIRAFCLGRLIAERYGHRVQSAGSIVTAALKLQAFKEHSQKEKNFEERVAFTPQEIVPFLPKPVQQAFEKKAGGQIASLSRSLVELGKFDDPVVLEEVEEAQGHPAGGKYQIIARRLVEHLRERSIHQLVFDAHGDVAARVCSVLRFRGHLEADAIANSAMVPVKDTREVRACVCVCVRACVF